MTKMHVIAMLLVARIVAACVATICAYQLALDGKDGWGWMIFLALALGCVSIESEKEKKDD